MPIPSSVPNLPSIKMQNHFPIQFKYHFDTTLKLIDLARLLPEKEQTAVLSIFFHVLLADGAWRSGLSGIKFTRPNPEDYPSLDSIRHAFEQEKASWMALLAGLTDEKIESQFERTNMRGEKQTAYVWKALHQVLYHGMQHHSELAVILTNAGHSPGNIDFIFYE